MKKFSKHKTTKSLEKNPIRAISPENINPIKDSFLKINTNSVKNSILRERKNINENKNIKVTKKTESRSYYNLSSLLKENKSLRNNFFNNNSNHSRGESFEGSKEKV